MIRVLRPGAAEWPALLDEMGPHQCPAELFVDGRSLTEASPAVAIVGTRRPTVAGLEIAREFASALAQAGLAVVSGLAVGIDGAAHRAALEAGGHTIGVLGCGLDVDYPRPHRALRARMRDEGTLVSEYPPGTPPHRAHFPARNRIIAALAAAVLVVEGGECSGALITARLALDANRLVLAVPGSVRNPMAAGPNGLIRASLATAVTAPEHVFEEIAPQIAWRAPVTMGPVPEPPNLDDADAAVLTLMDDSLVPVDRMAKEMDAPTTSVRMSLAVLEVRGYVRKRPGGYELTGSGAAARAALDARKTCEGTRCVHFT